MNLKEILKPERGGLFIALLCAGYLLGGAGWHRQAPSPDTQSEAGNLLEIAVKYADAMIAFGRDHYGKEHTPLFASAMALESMQLGSTEDFGSIPGVRETDRSVGGSNPLNDIALYGLLYQLTEHTGEEIYASEADSALNYFFGHCQSPVTGLMCWGEHLRWDFTLEACTASPDHEYHEATKWPFWDRCYELQPDACWNFVIGEWDHQIANKETGDFSRHARWSVHGPGEGSDFPRYAGQMIERWAYAYAREENLNRSRRDELKTAIILILNRMEENRHPVSGYLPAFRGAEYLWPSSNIELARCLWESAPRMDSDLSGRMKSIALRIDRNFLATPHQLDSGGGFAVTLNSETLEPRSRSMNKPYTTTWSTGYGYGTHAGIANRCYSRFLQLTDDYPEIASGYAGLILLAAEQYMETSPDYAELIKPESFANVIGLLLHSYDLTKKKRYVRRADELAGLGIRLFLPDGRVLPRASNQHDHYESLTGGPDFIKSLLDLYLTYIAMD